MLTLKNALLSAALLLAAAAPLAAQAPAWQWARSANGPGSDEVRAVATDAQGNVYVAGYFLGSSITFGSTVFTNPSLSQEAFLAKYNASGTLLWARQAGGIGFDLARGLATDPQGNVLMTGVTGSAQLSFGSAGASVSANSTRPMLGFDVFVAKYSPAGACLWARRGGGNNDDDANAVATDGAGNVYVAGNFASDVMAFGTATVAKTPPTGGSSLDGYLAKYDAAGTPQWVRGAGGTSDDEARSVSADAAGNTTVVGYFGANGFSIGGTFYPSLGAKDLFVARYNAAGALQWVKPTGCTIEDRAEDVALDAQGNVYLTGVSYGPGLSFGGSAVLGAQPSGSRGFVAKLGPTGAGIWARSAHTGYGDLALDANGDVYRGTAVSGTSVTFAGQAVPTSGGSASIGVFKFDRNGAEVWLKCAGSNYGEYNNDLALAPNGVVYVAGGFDGPTTIIGATTLTNTGTASVFTTDLFVAALGSTVSASRAEASASAGFAVFPNPGHGRIELRYPAGWAGGTLGVYNALGQVVRRTAGPLPTQLDLSGLAPGIYAVEVQAGASRLTHRLVVD